MPSRAHVKPFAWDSRPKRHKATPARAAFTYPAHVAFVVFEAMGADGGPPQPEIVAAPGGPGSETRVVGSYANWGAALRTVARLEAQARRKLRGAGGFALGIRSEP
jgi:hypothetical protein